MHQLARLEAQVRAMRRLVEADGPNEELILRALDIVSALRGLAARRLSQKLDVLIDSLITGERSDGDIAALQGLAELVRTSFRLPNARLAEQSSEEP